ncbi:hypothetical protein K438DRAFT_2000583 [Mycena galopus ATCC 62051]|nr:hypothetical protein K438DRAFT_2000583 [Mycena galopus ATCC 62051]
MHANEPLSAVVYARLSPGGKAAPVLPLIFVALLGFAFATRFGRRTPNISAASPARHRHTALLGHLQTYAPLPRPYALPSCPTLPAPPHLTAAASSSTCCYREPTRRPGTLHRLANLPYALALTPALCPAHAYLPRHYTPAQRTLLAPVPPPPTHCANPRTLGYTGRTPLTRGLCPAMTFRHHLLSPRPSLHARTPPAYPAARVTYTREIPQKAPPPPAKTTPGKHYQQRAQTQSNVLQMQRREQTQRTNTQPKPPLQQNTPNKKTGQGHDENENAPSSAEPTNSNSKPPPLGRTVKSDAGHGTGRHYGLRRAWASKRLSQPVLPTLEIPSSAPIRPQAQPQQRRPPPPAATSSKSLSESKEEHSDDDAPLATLVSLRRPRSAPSSFSGSNPNLVGSHTNLAANTNLPPSPLPPHYPGHKHSGSQSGSSIASSSRSGPNKSKPLIDIKELTASRPTQLLQKDGGKDDGFTGGGMLASALGGKANTNKQETEAPNPVLTSRSPPVWSETGLVHFPLPPSSPAKEARRHACSGARVSGKLWRHRS